VDASYILKSIEPKSDQLNADDLLTGPQVFKIVDVLKGGDEKQPVVCKIDGGKQPWKPCKSMRRVMVKIWGDSPRKWVGQSVRLWCDPSVMFGGMKVGGIRIEAMTGIERKTSVVLSESRGKRSEYWIEPLIVSNVSERFDKAIAAIKSVTDESTLSKYEQAIEEFWNELTQDQMDAIKSELSAAHHRIAKGK